LLQNEGNLIAASVIYFVHNSPFVSETLPLICNTNYFRDFVPVNHVLKLREFVGVVYIGIIGTS
jgi:hypothetical protein